MADKTVTTKKLVIIGDGSVGKTCFLYRFCENKFTEGYVPTIFENYNKEYEVDGQKKLLRISDTAGQEEYKNVRPLAYPGTDVVFIAFNIMSRASFENIMNPEGWFPEKKQHMSKAKTVLIGTKCDLKEDKKALEELRKVSGLEAQPVSKEEGDALAKQIKAYAYFETSAKENIGVTEALHAALEAAEKVDELKPSCICL